VYGGNVEGSWWRMTLILSNLVASPTSSFDLVGTIQFAKTQMEGYTCLSMPSMLICHAAMLSNRETLCKIISHRLESVSATSALPLEPSGLRRDNLSPRAHDKLLHIQAPFSGALNPGITIIQARSKASSLWCSYTDRHGLTGDPSTTVTLQSQAS